MELCWVIREQWFPKCVLQKPSHHADTADEPCEVIYNKYFEKSSVDLYFWFLSDLKILNITLENMQGGKNLGLLIVFS